MILVVVVVCYGVYLSIFRSAAELCCVLYCNNYATCDATYMIKYICYYYFLICMTLPLSLPPPPPHTYIRPQTRRPLQNPSTPTPSPSPSPTRYSIYIGNKEFLFFLISKYYHKTTEQIGKQRITFADTVPTTETDAVYKFTNDKKYYRKLFFTVARPAAANCPCNWNLQSIMHNRLQHHVCFSLLLRH